MKAVFVLGSTRCGKSTFVNDVPAPFMTLQVGQFLRGLLGSLSATDHPGSSRLTSAEELVRDMVKGALNLALRLDRPIVFDGFPRDVVQAQWIMVVLEVYLKKSDVAVLVFNEHHLYRCESDRERNRHLQSRADLEEVVNSFHERGFEVLRGNHSSFMEFISCLKIF